MSTEVDLERALRAAFRDAAEPVVAEPDPMGRLLSRRKRRFGTSLFASLTAVAAVVGAFALPAAFSPAEPDSDHHGHPIGSEWSRSLLESPVRGSLAGDETLLAEVQQLAEQRGDKTLGQVKVLFLGDVSGRRFVAFARYDDRAAALYTNDIPQNGTTTALLDGGAANLPLTPLLTLTSAEAPVVVGLAPAACRLATSTAGAFGVDGDVRRTWTDAPGGSWITRDTRRPAERWRVTCDSVVRSEGPAVALGDVDATTDVVAAGGLAHKGMTERWTGTIEGVPGTWTVRTANLENGGVAAVLSDGSERFTLAPSVAPPGSDRNGWGLMSTTVSADPDVIAIRVPARSGGRTYHTERAIILTTKQYAWKIGGNAEIGAFESNVIDGFAQFNIGAGPVLVFDVTDQVIGRTYLHGTGDILFGENLVSAW